MAWRAITEADLLQRLSGDELEAFRAASLGSAQGDPVQGAIEQVTEQVRGYIAAHSANTLGPAGTLPARLIRAACDLLVIDVSTRAAGTLIDPDGVRKRNADAATRLLEQVAGGDYAIEEPEEAGTDSAAAPGPSTFTRDRTFDRASQDGI